MDEGRLHWQFHKRSCFEDAYFWSHLFVAKLNIKQPGHWPPSQTIKHRILSKKELHSSWLSHHKSPKLNWGSLWRNSLLQIHGRRLSDPVSSLMWMINLSSGKEIISTRWFKVTFSSTSWRSLNHPKRLHRIARKMSFTFSCPYFTQFLHHFLGSHFCQNNNSSFEEVAPLLHWWPLVRNPHHLPFHELRGRKVWVNISSRDTLEDERRKEPPAITHSVQGKWCFFQISMMIRPSM